MEMVHAPSPRPVPLTQRKRKPLFETTFIQFNHWPLETLVKQPKKQCRSVNKRFSPETTDHDTKGVAVPSSLLSQPTRAKLSPCLTSWKAAFRAAEVDQLLSGRRELWERCPSVLAACCTLHSRGQTADQLCTQALLPSGRAPFMGERLAATCSRMPW